MHTLPLADQAAEALHKLALDEDAKRMFCHDPWFRPFTQRVARRYVAGQTIGEAMQRARAIAARGHAVSLEYMGESVRDAARANAETEVFLALIATLDNEHRAASISFDLSHIGLLVSPELGYRNLCRIAGAAGESGREVMISAEGSDRADLIHAAYVRVHEEAGLHHVGITLQARLRRSDADLQRLMAYPGKIRLVKGAFLEPAELALARGSTELRAAFLDFARKLLLSGHPCSVATHDRSIQGELADLIVKQELPHDRCEFESLIGLGTEQIDDLQRKGFRTREYAGFGEETFLYVLNRIAEEPSRLYQALIDLSADTAPA